MRWKILLTGTLLPTMLALLAGEARAQAMLECSLFMPLRPGEGARVVFASPPGSATAEDPLLGFNFQVEMSGILDATCRQIGSYAMGTSFAAPAVHIGLDAASTRVSLDDGGTVEEIDLDPCFGGQPVAVLLGTPIPPADASEAAPPMPVVLGATIFGPDDKVRAAAGGGIANLGTVSLQNDAAVRIWPGRTLVIPYVGPGQAAEVYLAPRPGAADAPPPPDPEPSYYTITLTNTASADCVESVPLQLDLQPGANTLRLEKDGAVLRINGEEVFLSESCLHGAAGIEFEFNQSSELTADPSTPAAEQLPHTVVLGYAITEPGETAGLGVLHLKSKIGSLQDDGESE